MSEDGEAVVENRVPNTPAKEPANSRRLLLSALGVLGGAATLSGCLNAQEAQALETGQVSQSILLTGFSADLADLRLYVGKYDASTGYYTRENIYVFVGVIAGCGLGVQQSAIRSQRVSFYRRDERFR